MLPFGAHLDCQPIPYACKKLPKSSNSQSEIFLRTARAELEHRASYEGDEEHRTKINSLWSLAALGG